MLNGYSELIHPCSAHRSRQLCTWSLCHDRTTRVVRGRGAKPVRSSDDRRRLRSSQQTAVQHAFGTEHTRSSRQACCWSSRSHLHSVRHANSSPMITSGVGKSMSHALLAQALYIDSPDTDMQCPGTQCPGYKVNCIVSQSCLSHGHTACPCQWGHHRDKVCVSTYTTAQLAPTGVARHGPYQC